MCTRQQRSTHLGTQEMFIKVFLGKGVQPQRAQENETSFQLCDRSCTVSSKKFWMGEVHGTTCNMSTERGGDTVSPECTGHCAAGSEYCWNVHLVTDTGIRLDITDLITNMELSFDNWFTDNPQSLVSCKNSGTKIFLLILNPQNFHTHLKNWF